MSRDVMGGADDDRHRLPGDDLDVRHDLDRDDHVRDGDHDLGPVTAGAGAGRRRPTIATRAPVAVTAALGLTAAALGWFTPDLLAATNPPPPTAVATVAGSSLIYPDIGSTALDLQIEITNLGPTRVTVSDPRPIPLFAPIGVVPGGTGTTPVRITPDCHDPSGPQLRVTDAAGATVDVPITGVRSLLVQSCSLMGTIPADSGVTVDLAPRGGSVQLSGDITTDGDTLVLPLVTTDPGGAVLTSPSLGDLPLTVRGGPVRLGHGPTNVVLEPVRTCPADWAYTSPPTDVGLTVAPSRVGARGADPVPGNSYVMYLQLPQVTAWVLRTACPDGVP